MRSIDYLVRGERVKTNARLRAFAETEVCRKMLRDENYASWARRKGRALRKEIAEAMVTCAFIREELVAMDGSARGEKSIVVFDLCSGKGLTSSVCAETLGKNCEVIMVDSDRKMKLTHLDSERQVVHFALDVYDEALDEMMARATTRASAIHARARRSGRRVRRTPVRRFVAKKHRVVVEIRGYFSVVAVLLSARGSFAEAPARDVWVRLARGGDAHRRRFVRFVEQIALRARPHARRAVFRARHQTSSRGRGYVDRKESIHHLSTMRRRLGGALRSRRGARERLKMSEKLQHIIVMVDLE